MVFPNRRIHRFRLTATATAMLVQINCGSAIHTPPTIRAHAPPKVNSIVLSEYIVDESLPNDHR